MPALQIFKQLSTRPFAGDDLQIVCLVLASYRLIQFVCLLPIIIDQVVSRMQGNDLIINGFANHCPQYFSNNAADYLVITVDDQGSGFEVTRNTFGLTFAGIAALYMVIDVAWILAVWSAACMGTPTEPMGRDEYLRPLLIFKIFAVNIFPILLLVFGVLQIAATRKDNYGCFEETPVYYPDKGAMYALFSILLVTYALELLIWPTIITNKFIRYLRGGSRLKNLGLDRNSTHSKGKRLESCLGGILKCVSVLCCNKAGGHDLKNKGELKDFASNLMEFANNDTKVDVTLSDMYVGLKMLARVQGERRVEAIRNLHKASLNKDIEETVVVDPGDYTKTSVTDRRALLITPARNRNSILTLKANDEDEGFYVVEKNVLSPSNEDDVRILKNAAHFSIYAQYIYFHVRDVATMDFGLAEDSTSFFRDIETILEDHSYSMASVGMEQTQLMHANFFNGICQTPYAILLDGSVKSVVVAVRGTSSLEDWVVDLQYVPLPLDQVGKVVGYGPALEGHHCHKGVLSRAKWLYNDIKKNRVLKRLFSDESPYRNYDLTVVGHSLGGGCAQVLSLMLRPSYPTLKCFAYEPPGCILDDKLAGECEEFITSIVRNDDLVPRITQQNLETLRDEFFDVVARMKISKIKVFQDVRVPCADEDLQRRNAGVLYPKGQASRDTPFYSQIRKFRTERAEKNKQGEVSVKLYIPGKLIHVVDAPGSETTKYVPYWANRYDFNQVVLSKSMLSDHAIPDLVSILKSIDLEEYHEHATFQTSDVTEETKYRFIGEFICCSYPHGKVPLILTLSSIIAIILSILSNQVCKFVTRTTTIVYPNGTTVPGTGVSAGLYSYALQQCINPNACDRSDAEDLEDSKYCQPYPGIVERDSNWTASNVFSALSVVFGVLGIVILSFSTCTKMKRNKWIIGCVLFLMATLSQGLQFLFLNSDLCKTWTHPITGALSIADCSLSTGGYYGVSATVLWFVSAVGCAHMTRSLG
mmetsp:Transcript_29580/g.59412  ORF Transcript_29580/g.59412 Transcript_29580/m.59412 type:complete len:985 (+) Transcript_29580:263-3217(+)